MPSFCVVSNCEYKYTHAENISFHKFPRHSKDILAKWIKFTDRGENWLPSRWSAICSRHFHSSDYRDLSSARKCLRRDAVPSVVVNNYEGEYLSLRDGEEPLSKVLLSEQSDNCNCRLCGQYCKTVTTLSNNFDVLHMIQKCFPSLNIQVDDALPKDLCYGCLQRLQNFSEFVDHVLKTQKEYEKKLSTKSNCTPALINERPLKIKQEPHVKIKQEISENVQGLLGGECEVGAEEEEYAEYKSQFSEFPFANTQEIVNNCDIIEIITLDDAFIDIPDDEAGNEEQFEPKVFLQNSATYPNDEHNYSQRLQKVEFLKPNPYKIEKYEDNEIFIQEPMKSNRDIIVINESIVRPVPSYDLYQCNDCPMQFLTEGILNEHKKLNHDLSAYLCEICNIKFKTFFDLLKHKVLVHKKKTTTFKSKTIIHSCSKCKKAFSSKLALNNHTKYICKYQQEKSYECNYCKKVLNKWILLKQHEKLCKLAVKKLEPQQNENGKFSCGLCGRTYISRRNAMLHERSHRPQEEWNYKCADCEKMFDFCRDLRRHLNNKECKGASQPQGPGNLYFICTTCGRQFKSLTKLKWHTLIHAEVKPFVCETCGKAFRSFNNLHQHKVTHTTVRSHKCDLCEKMFKRRGGLNQHKRAFHFRLKPHECPICKHRYALKGDMIRCKHSALKDRTF